MLRDKDYVQAKGNLLFNVTGYQHPPSGCYASLKYVDGEKWTTGYAAAIEFLRSEHDEFVDEYIQVPLPSIEQTFRPAKRWRELKQNPRLANPLHEQALELGDRLGSILGIPESADDPHGEPSFGITDSLLWGDGHKDSDIDLVVIGLQNTAAILNSGSRIFHSPDFDRPDPNVMRSPYGLQVENWPQILARKVHMGSYRGRLFSLRGVLSYAEIRQLAHEVPLGRNRGQQESQGKQSVNFTIADNLRSLLFPAVYQNENGDELVDYSVVYEGVFRIGDVVRCESQTEKIRQTFPGGAPNKTNVINRYTIDGTCELIHRAD